MIVTTGSIALRSTCRRVTTDRVMPLASAVRTKSSLLTSCTAARVIRVMIASGMVPSATAGRIRCFTASQAAGRSPVMTPSSTKKPVGWSVTIVTSCRPVLGSHPELDGEDVLEQEAQREHRDGDADQASRRSRRCRPTTAGLRPAT